MAAEISRAGADVLFEQAACGLLTTTANGTIERVNAMFCLWTGYTAAELVGKRRIQDLLTIGCRVFHQTHWAPLLQLQGSVAEVKLDVRHRDGRVLPMLFNAVRRIDGNVTCDHIAVMVVTDREKYEAELVRARTRAEAAQAQLAHSDRQKDEFLATLSHELRNPLTPMRNVTEILKRKDLTDPQLIWARDVLGRQVDHLSHLVNDLLEVSRFSQGKITLRRQVMDLADAVHAAVEAVGPLMQAAAQNLTVSLPAEPVRIDADPVRMAQVMQNLLNNASKYTPDGGRIWLEVGAEGDEAVARVRDGGIGIPPDQVDHVFDMFSQLEPALKRAQGGLGIGLSLVRSLLQLHGGTVTARSDGSGQGSEFTVRLPLCRQPIPDSPLDVAPAGAVPVGRRILIVDDNVDSAETLSELLDFSGHQTSTAHNGPDAIERARQTLPDAIVMDIGLPGMSGYEAAALIRQEPWGKQILLIALTGWGQPQDKRAAEDAGFDHHLTKPLDIEALDALLSTARASRDSAVEQQS